MTDYEIQCLVSKRWGFSVRRIEIIEAIEAYDELSQVLFEVAGITYVTDFEELGMVDDWK